MFSIDFSFLFRDYSHYESTYGDDDIENGGGSGADPEDDDGDSAGNFALSFSALALSAIFVLSM